MAFRALQRRRLDKFIQPSPFLFSKFCKRHFLVYFSIYNNIFVDPFTTPTHVIMSNTRNRRYIFIDFSNLKKVKFKKLEKVCDKVFIMINAEEDLIPLDLVIQMQRLGKGVKWIAVNETDDMDMNFLLSFLMGKMHQKASKDIEFAILSNDSSFDALVNFINAEGRSCLRVKRKKTYEERVQEYPSASGSMYEHPSQTDNATKPFLPELALDDAMIETIAELTIDRMRMQGKRPENLQMLRSFILLNNQELTEPGNVDKVIQRMQQLENITLSKGEVIYNF